MIHEAEWGPCIDGGRECVGASGWGPVRGVVFSVDISFGDAVAGVTE